MAYVYRHIRLDKNIPFYIGVGVDDNEGKFKRSKAKEHRNDYWHRIIAKTDYRVDIIINDLSWEEACEKEKEFIKLYGRKDKSEGFLANQTDGGDGGAGVIVKPETREKIRQFQISLDKKGKPGRVWTQESKDKLANTIRGIKHTPEAIENMRAGHAGFKHSEESKLLISKVSKASQSSPEYRQKKSAIAKAKWQDPAFRATMLEKMKVGKAASIEGQISHSNKMKDLWDNPEYKAKVSAAIKATSLEPGSRKKRSEAASRSWETRKRGT